MSRFSAAKTMHSMQYATDIELHVHTYAVGVADIAAHEGSPHNVLHLSSYVVCIILLVIIMCSCLLPCMCDARREEGE